MEIEYVQLLEVLPMVKLVLKQIIKAHGPLVYLDLKHVDKHGSAKFQPNPLFSSQQMATESAAEEKKKAEKKKK